MTAAVGMRFTPPRAPLPVELRWLLAAAFGSELPPPAGEPGRAAELARTFDLGPRIVARHGAAALGRLGEAAEEMIAAHRRAVAVALIAERTARRLAELAGPELPMVYLKGFALTLLAPGPAGIRPLADLDVLLPQRGAEELRRRLLADGWVSEQEAGNPQHLPPLRPRQGLPVDLHFRLRGVRAGASRWATADELIAAGLCRPAGLAGSGWIPGPALMAAHVAVHAFEQHGHRPATYPLLRAVADIADLTAAAEADDLEPGAAGLVGETLDPAGLQALFDLARILAEGRIPADASAGESAAAKLLRHVVAGSLDPVYRRGLAIDHTTQRLRQAYRDGRLMRYIAFKLRGPGDLPVTATGESAGGLESAGGRLMRPIRIGARLASAAIARLRRNLERRTRE